ncbi:MBL fold metallo-hydrolase [SAR202 cluster bacterium AD-804-J14_MRT_500m]|nr:MBL fold metallo-hydrolase [SAR202 cluster bacterium AD-804-J14_MRT_500m]
MWQIELGCSVLHNSEELEINIVNRDLTVGNVQITALSDGALQFDLCSFFPSISPKQWDPYRDHLVQGPGVRFNLSSYIIRSEGKVILIDTGMGPKPIDDPNCSFGQLMDDMKATGIRPSDIDMVVMTHLHRDHIGWNVLSEGGFYAPTFPKARYWVSDKDWDACHQPDIQPTRFPNAPERVWPLDELDICEIYEGEHAFTSEVVSLPTPGHTPGHMSLLISSQGQRALILGDVLHNPAQVEETDWVSRADMDPRQTRITRSSVLQQIETEGILAVVGHFPAPGYGHLIRLEGRRYWQPI